ncbi:hypothetical protein KsCSTR_39140 [Candidatus Kuenenia stuttgartiensis]|uniref:Uncharacterized protein n=1 Tax=Kuenenia stuttgartiensis TaxID=174633 RepID=A0A6G7GVE8_KUEST|nr:hypothetical protein KsCSTR_39140 [Candidatus Kuenenia stuttgartiensis]
MNSARLSLEKIGTATVKQMVQIPGSQFLRITVGLITVINYKFA